MSMTMANAHSTKTQKIEVNKRYNETVTFSERGIKFHVFLNGDFDFNTRANYNYGVKIKRDRRGKIRRVGNVFINYDHRGNVKRVGNIFMNYRFGQLTKVGGLLISYDRWGNPFFKGRVKGNRYNNDRYNDNNCSVNVGVNVRDVYDYNDVYFYRKSFKKNYYKIREDNNFFYYKSRSKAIPGKRNQIIKRRKAKKKIYRKHTRRSRK